MEKSRTLVLIATMRSLTTGCPDPTHLRAQLRQETTTSASDRARLSPMHGCPETGEHDSFLVSHRVSRIPLLEGRETVAGITAIPRYARVSTTGQALSAKVTALRPLVWAPIWCLPTNFPVRRGLVARAWRRCLTTHAGDIVVVTATNRLRRLLPKSSGPSPD